MPEHHGIASRRSRSTHPPATPLPAPLPHDACCAPGDDGATDAPPIEPVHLPPLPPGAPGLMLRPLGPGVRDPPPLPPALFAGPSRVEDAERLAEPRSMPPGDRHDVTPVMSVLPPLLRGLTPALALPAPLRRGGADESLNRRCAAATSSVFCCSSRRCALFCCSSSWADGRRQEQEVATADEKADKVTR